MLIGAVTSLAGLITTITAALSGHASLAVSNSLGGIAVQTVFLAMADVTYRRANLEHAAASEANLQQGALLLTMLAIALVCMATPELMIGWLHPGSVVLILAYLFGIRLVSRAHDDPMWHPRQTGETEAPSGGPPPPRGTPAADWLAFAALAAAVAAGGWLVAYCGINLASQLNLDESLVGGVFTSISTSLPELVIALAAVRRGALTLAVGDILGGNTFDVLFLSMADAFYLDGSIYAAVARGDRLWASVAMLMAAVLQMGLLRRERHGLGNIGFESALVLLLYLGTVALLVVG